MTWTACPRGRRNQRNRKTSQVSQAGQSLTYETQERHFALCHPRSCYPCLPAACRACADALEPARDRRALLRLRRDGLAARHACHHGADPPERRSRPDAQPRHALRRRQCRGRHAHLPVRARWARVLSQRVGAAHGCLELRGLLCRAQHRHHCAAAGRSADRHGLRRAHASPRHALRDGGGWQLGDDRRHPGGADGTTQGPSLRPRQLHDPRPAARLRCHARSRRREAQPAALADEAHPQGRLAGGELRRSSRCRRELAALRPRRAVDAQRAPGCALVRRAGAKLRGSQRRYRQRRRSIGRVTPWRSRMQR